MIRSSRACALYSLVFAWPAAAQPSPRVAAPRPEDARPVESPLAAARPTAPSPTDTTRIVARTAPIVTAYPLAAAGDGATVATYSASRWAEDWQPLRDPAKRKDVFDRLKYLPLNETGDVYLTLNGELRARVNLATNPGLRKSEAQRQDVFRAFAGADLHLGTHLRVYGELAHGGLDGENLGTPAGNLRNKLAVQELFAEAQGEIAGSYAGIRVGRQEFADGSNLVVSQRDNNTLRFVLDGVRAYARGKHVRVDIFDLYFTRYGNEGLSDDDTDKDRRFSGVVVGYSLPTAAFGGSKLYVDPFIYRMRNRDQLWGKTTAREERGYVGARLWGDVGPLALDWTLDHQFGTFDRRTINAWQVFVAQTYRLGEGGTAPRVGFHVDYGSGGGDARAGNLNAAMSPFGNNVYFSYGSFLSPINFRGIAPNLTFSPVKPLRVVAEYQIAQRADAAQPVYRAAGTAYAGTEKVAGRDVAQVARLQAIWTLTPRLSVTGRVEHLNAGKVLTRAGYSDSVYGAAWINYRF